ncbi:hypothetical protein B0T14DRAFT_570731 [Immersiella caudata]|uniref:Uncharacterized protein n=1 Tax=Immersiella caudata TaxID=314043 RepID=A0AA39T1A2_9PEZI|nr:hypothetical protein B0T14DRAFT_570731 [Immersiella caudata]
MDACQNAANPDIGGIGVNIAVIAQSSASIILCATYICIHGPHRNTGYGSKRWLFALNGAIFKTMISMTNAMTVLALGLVIGLALNKTSMYHTALVGLQMTIMTYSVFLTHYLVWRTRNWFPKLENDIIDYRYFGISKRQFFWQRSAYLVVLLGAWIGSIVLTFTPASTRFCDSGPRLSRSKPSWVDETKYGSLILLLAIVILSAYLEGLRFLKRHGNSQRPFGDETFGEAATRWRRRWACYGLGRLSKVLQYTWPLSAIVACGVYTWILFEARREFSTSFGSDDDQWGVGQILALVLFINPFVDFFFSVWQVNSEINHTGLS